MANHIALPENPEYIWFLLSRHLTGEATEAEKAMLQKWLNEDPRHHQQFELLQQLWQAKLTPQETAAEPAKISRILQLAAVEEALHNGNDHITDSALPKKLRPWKIATVLIILAVVMWAAFYWRTGSHTLRENNVVAQKGSRTRAILPDGSIVWLNAGSSISYGESFNEKIREVTLHGEGFFDVVKQPDRPFIVHAGNIQIRVLGTSFNVRSYPEDEVVETTLIKGLVQITRPGRSQPIYLHLHQKIVLPASGSAAEPGEPKVSDSRPGPDSKLPENRIADLDTSLKENERPETAWLYNRLEFRGDDFASLAKKLERWYNITIHFDDERVKALTFNGSIESESVAQAFKALQLAVPFNYSIKGNEISIGSYQKTAP